MSVLLLKQKQTAYLQLKGGRGLWHGVVDEGVAERHKLVSDDFNGLLRRRTWWNEKSLICGLIFYFLSGPSF